MTDVHKKITAYHDEKVTLPKSERDEMRERRDANRKRLDNSDIKPNRFQSQGSYAMHTMVQQPDKDYDIDDGAYYSTKDIEGLTPGDIKEKVRSAIDDGSFKRPPEVRKNCVRVNYDKGYHVDIPIYRIIGEDQFELAGDEKWTESNPAAVTSWFSEQNQKKSPDANNGGQLRRVTRLLKAYARSREDWRDKIATGLMISKLVVDHYESSARDDKALEKTMRAVKKALEESLEIDHPVVKGEKLTKGLDDPKAKLFLDALVYALKILDKESDKLKAWGIIFDTDFFCKDTNGSNPSGGTPSRLSVTRPSTPVNKQGGDRYA